MKKLYLILVLMTAVAMVQAQSQLKTVRGKTREGKNVVVQYYQGSFEDNIESVKYQVVDELQAKVNTLQKDTKILQDKVNEANRQVQQLQKKLDNQVNKSNDEAMLLTEINEKNIEIDSLNSQIATMNEQVRQLEIDKAILVAELDSVKHMPQPQISPQISPQIPPQILPQNKTVNQPLTQPTKSSVIGLEAGIGSVLYGTVVNKDWDGGINLSTQIDAYYGTPRLTSVFPVSIEAGLGMRFFGMSAQRGGYELTIDGVDIDNQTYHGYYSYSDLSEKLALTYLDIPIRICIGQPIRNQVSVYAKIGITPSICLKSEFNGTGTYTLKGYYPDLDITFEDIEELGFVSNASCYPEGFAPNVNKFVLLGNVAVGACVPFGTWPVQLNAGVKLDYPFMSLGSAAGAIALPNGMGLLHEGNVVIPSATIGLIYTLK